MFVYGLKHTAGRLYRMFFRHKKAARRRLVPVGGLSETAAN